MATETLPLVVLALAVALARLAWVPQPKPLVVRVDEVGRAEAMEARADPLDPTTGFFLHRSLSPTTPGGRGRSAKSGAVAVAPNPEVANTAYTEQAEEVAAPAVELTDEELQGEDMAVRILPQPAEPHGVAASSDLVRMRGGEELARDRVPSRSARSELRLRRGRRRPHTKLADAARLLQVQRRTRPERRCLQDATITLRIAQMLYRFDNGVRAPDVAELIRQV